VYKSGICDTIPGISLKPSSLESQSYYRVSVETHVWPIDYLQICSHSVNFGLLFRGVTFFHNGYLAQFLSQHDEVCQC